ncbi:MAG: SpoIID/LytB domain-containing protein [Leptolyngbyaceae cyanobacterium CSU_1_4]|nr:SpoIID/LytB domain-containing protein [Leptolyngbyaceae cyanobacterium CSU_1_4]
MTGQSLLLLLKRRIWLALPLLVILAIGGVLWGQRSPNTALNPAPPAASVPPDASSELVPSSPPTSRSSASPSPTVTPTSAASPTQTPTPAPSPTAAVDPNALTAAEKALNEAAKQKIARSGTASVDNLVEMRVAIAQGVPALSLTVTQGAVLVDAQTGSQIQDLSGSYSLQPSGDGMQLDSQALPFAIRIEPTPGGSITLGDRTYRGRFVIVNDAGKLWAVNLVNLRQYLYSVVASEVSPDWDTDALKAQAIAARSYALTYHFKPISSLFDMGSTEYYQVYSGIAREADTTSQAVDATAGEYVSYKGGVVESLYAASEDIVAEAFQGQGMSQLGALRLAEQGFTYQQILEKYYPGTKVGRFQQDY